MSAEHADGRTRGVILPHVFGRELFDLFVQIKELMDPRFILHPGVKIIPEARDKKLDGAIEELVGIEEKDSRLNLARFRDFSHLFSGACSFCSQCADICPVFDKLSGEFTTRSQAAPAFKRSLAMALDIDGNLESLKDDPLLRKVFDLCLLCGQCTFKCATNASMRDIVIRMRESRRSKVVAPVLDYLMAHRGAYSAAIRLLGATQGIWSNRVSRGILSLLPKELLPTRIPAQRYLPKLSKSGLRDRYPELADIPASQADIALFYGCTSDLFEEPLAAVSSGSPEATAGRSPCRPSVAAASPSAPPAISPRPIGSPGTTSTSLRITGTSSPSVPPVSMGLRNTQKISI